MILPLLQLLHLQQVVHGVPMERFYALAGISRQGYFQALNRQKQRNDLLVELGSKARKYRNTIDARAGSRSMYYNLNIREQYKIGVNRFELMMAEIGLSLKPLRIKVVTTKSSKQSWNYSNLINGLELNAINQVVVGDITYVSFDGVRFYLFCLTDIFSARIVGWTLSLTMKSVNALNTLEQWVRLRGEENLRNCFHHTDGGGQYFSALYLNRLNNLGIQISRAENCMENGYAEQRNGLLKNHILPLINHNSITAIRRQLNQLINKYNHERKQQNLGWLSPVEYEIMLQTNHKPITKKLHNFNQGCV